MANFNGEMFSAILASNEKALALVEKQLVDAKEQAKRNDKKFYTTTCILSILLGVMIWAYANKKAEIEIGYDQNTTDTKAIEDSTIDIKNVDVN